VPPPSRLKLPFTFDPAGLLADLARIPDAAWRQHFNKGDYEGDWGVVPLRAAVGAALPIAPSPSATHFEDTALLQASPAFQDVLARLPFPLKVVRLLRLGPGSRIREHTDPRLGYADGELRLHVPITTSPQVAFYADGEPVQMAPGECWYVDVSRPHRVDNESDQPRVHLVIDATVNPWVDALFAEARAHPSPAAPSPPAAPPREGGLQRLLEQVFSDPALQERLLAFRDRRAFVTEVLAVAEASGLTVRPGEVEAAMNANHRAWIERRIL
jgi:quercetin dioxygenase-like cupin family protein